MQVLVTGATGFIGGNLARLLVERGYRVRALVRPGSRTLTIDGTPVETVPGDILDGDSVRQAMAGCQAVFHCAAAYTFWAADPRSIYRTNVAGTATVLEAARVAGVSRVVYTSTVSTIGLPSHGLGDEDTQVTPRYLVGHYKKSKYQAEQLALAQAAQGSPVVVVNPTTPVGPWDVRPTPTGGMVLDFLLGRIPAYVGTGMNLVDVADVAEGHILALEKGQPGQRYLLGCRNVTLKEMFAMLQGITGKRAPQFKAPFWLALAAGYLDNLVEGQLLRREPRIPLEGLKVARQPMYVTCQKAVTQLGLPQSPVEPALERAVRWFTDYGYTRGK
ncbi:MAG: NAD-dependent epimerase/dehydratase family protein [SAR202 cluster bacterium]|nr:NAD-dependent epimerase/dehydratase family protein [SAR202 cluster bacterium]